MSRDLGGILCASCGALTLRRAATQIYCAPCSADRSRERGREWAKANPLSNEITRRKSVQTASAMVKAGREISEASRVNASWPAWIAEPDLHQVVRVAVPFDYGFSKNAIWRQNGRGHVYLREHSKRLRDELANRIRKAGVDWFQGKLYIDLYVEKPNQRGDAINVIDLVCDAVKEATSVDDRWYSIRRLDWSIVKENPRLWVGIGQEVSEDHQVCSYCGRILTLECFGSNKARKNGRSLACRDCSSPKRRGSRRDAA